MKTFLKYFFEKVDIMQFIIAFGMLTSFMFIVGSLVLRTIPAENKEALIHVLGILEGIITSIVMFYYGSSKGSQKKDEALKQKDEMILARDDKPGVTITPEPGTTTTTEVTTEH